MIRTCVLTRGAYALFHGGGFLIRDREIAFAANEKMEEGSKEEFETITLFTILQF